MISWILLITLSNSVDAVPVIIPFYTESACIAAKVKIKQTYLDYSQVRLTCMKQL